MNQTRHNLSRLFPGNPYEGFDPANHPDDLQGWGSRDPVFEQAIAAVRPSLIIEVGTWKGRSAIHMADICKAQGLDTTILCVDTWLGSPEMWLPDPGKELWHDWLRLKNGFPQVYYTFLANVVRRGHQTTILPLPVPSDTGAQLLGKLGVVADIIYIDAAHVYKTVKRDLADYWRLLAMDGVMIGDDYHPRWPGVIRAADEFAAAKGKRLLAKKGKFLIPAGKTMADVAAI